MLFNSLQFALFFIVMYGLYLALTHKWQNRMLLVAGCVFYGAWDWRFLLLMFGSVSVDYFCAVKIGSTDSKSRRKAFLVLSVFVNLTILGFFKYFNFFVESFFALLAHFGFGVHTRLLEIILPLGISFYTFEAMSYIIDVYRKQLEPTKSYSDYILFVTFFPHLIAGPIMRARDLLPQMSSPRNVTIGQFYEGAYLFFWGLFQKMFIADNLGRIVDPVFASNGPYDGGEVIIAIYGFAFQIYCDFAGYSNMARGLGRCMGFNIMINFNFPYFASNPSDFWSRWHISLSTWLRDYLYIPLGGNRGRDLMTCRNLSLTFLLGGLWHGAAWTFVFWGLYHGALLIIHRFVRPILTRLLSPRSDLIRSVLFPSRVLGYFQLTCLGWLIFRATSIRQVFDVLTSAHPETVNC